MPLIAPAAYPALDAVKKGVRSSEANYEASESNVLLNVAQTLLQRLRTARRVPARLIGVALSSLATDSTADQLTLFEARDSRLVETERDRTVSRVVDRVRARFGDKGILPGGLI